MTTIAMRDLPHRLNVSKSPPLAAAMDNANRWLLAISCATLLSVTTTTSAASRIAPVIIDVPADGRAVVSVTNDRDRAVLYQLTALNWQVIDGKDHYEVTQDFIASPPLFTLAATETQAVRIGFRNPAGASAERAYRLVVAEVPNADEAREDGGVIDFAIQFMLPVYVASGQLGAKPDLVWSMHASADAVVLRARNVGARRIALTVVGLSIHGLPGSAPEFAVKELTTVLAKTWREWRIPVPPDKVSLPLHVVYLQQGSTVPVHLTDANISASSAR